MGNFSLLLDESINEVVDRKNFIFRSDDLDRPLYIGKTCHW